MRIIGEQGKTILLNRIQCLRDFISSILNSIEELEEQRTDCCNSINSVTDEEDLPVLDEEKNNINF